MSATEKRSIPTTVAFHACFSHYAGNLGRAHELGYDYVFVDTHAAYDKFSGTFRVPSEGVYAFTWTTFTYYGDIVLELLVNGVVKGRSHSASTGDVISSTGFVIISAAVNDVVMVRTHPNFDPRGVIRSDGSPTKWSFHRVLLFFFYFLGTALTEEPWRKELLELKEVVKQQTRRLQDNHNQLQNQLNLIAKLTDEKIKLESRILTLERLVLDQNESTIDKHILSLAKWQEKTHVEISVPSTVAFHVCFSNNVENLGRVHELAYDQVLEDTHAAYDKFSGTYRVV
ncbi:uncharacterized protein LOC134264225 [Saccostrea cucullata]|uniref:uncharacterized protein LOC134264225 n=1 Tax=Saccostrea cuccullata TaxID=36930 RepID=UPI002ED0C2AA